MVKTKCILLSHTSLALSAFKYFKTVCRILSAFNQRKLKKKRFIVKKNGSINKSTYSWHYKRAIKNVINKTEKEKNSFFV